MTIFFTRSDSIVIKKRKHNYKHMVIQLKGLKIKDGLGVVLFFVKGGCKHENSYN